MRALASWKAVVEDRSNFLEETIGLLEERGSCYCAIDGVALNPYVEPDRLPDLHMVAAVGRPGPRSRSDRTDPEPLRPPVRQVIDGSGSRDE